MVECFEAYRKYCGELAISGHFSDSDFGGIIVRTVSFQFCYLHDRIPEEPTKLLAIARPASGWHGKGETAILRPFPADRKFGIALPVKTAMGCNTIYYSVGYYYCREGAGGICPIGSATWIVLLKSSATTGKSDVRLRQRARKATNAICPV